VSTRITAVGSAPRDACQGRFDRLLHLAERTMVVFFKDATDKRHQHVLERPDFLRSGRHTLLIRDPRSAAGDRGR